MISAARLASLTISKAASRASGRSGDPVKQEDAKLLFVGRDGKYYLAEVWCIQDRRVVTAEFDHRGQRREEQRQVSLMYP
jgi:hypothetical protein